MLGHEEGQVNAWTPKAYEEREIPMPTELPLRLKACHPRRSENNWRQLSRLPCLRVERTLAGHRRGGSAPVITSAEAGALDSEGKPQFRDLLFSHADPVFYAFELPGSTCMVR